jgi:hypothetical protein
MTGSKNSLSSHLVKGITVGAGIALVAPLVFPTLSKAATPAKKAALRFANVIYEKLLETSAELSEIVDDAIAETQTGTQAEMEQASNTVEQSPKSQKNIASVSNITGRQPEKKS